MGYKRKVRVAFLSEGDPSLAPLAAQIAAVAADWIEARAAWLTRHEGEAELLDSTLLAWADLVVTLDAMAEAQCPALPAGVLKRYYPVGKNPNEELQRRIAGMVGGLRLMERTAG